MKKILFVCLGNICRSPAAEGVMKQMVKDAGLESKIQVDSAGTSAYHVGSPPDARMTAHAARRGYKLTGRARAFDPDRDFKDFDYIVTMDEDNFETVTAEDADNLYDQKVHRLVSFCEIHDIGAVPDPYYGGDAGFELVMDIVEDGCRGLLARLKKELKV